MAEIILLTDVVGYEGIYMVNDIGEVFRKKKDGSLRKVKQQYDSYGYPIIKLSIDSNSVSHRIHRLVFFSFNTEYDINDSKIHVDHKDRNITNNKLINLRHATHQQNLRNVGKWKNKVMSSNYKGVSWDKSRKKWYVSVAIDGRSKYIGRFENEKDAARAYNQYVKAIDPDFFHLNEI